MKLFDAEPDFIESPEGLIIKRSQLITSQFLDGLKDARAHTAPEGDFMHVASIPTVVVEQWLREGFDIYKASAREIVSRLRRSDYQAFLATNKRV